MIPKPRVLLLGLLLAVATPSLANAAPPGKPATLDGGPYFQISPGIATLVAGEHRFARDARWAWPWSLGAGRMLSRGDTFKATLGASLEHRVFFIGDVRAHGAHAFFETRMGGGKRRVWGYGLIGVGAAATIFDFGFVRRRTTHDVDDFYGVVLQFGGGAQVLASRHFFLGGEFDFDLGFYFPHYRHSLDPFWYHTVTLEVTLGWYF